jgi:predicted nuclease of predicted toxin-antitoxin system
VSPAGTLRFKVDENCPLEFVELLRGAAYDADHVLDEGLAGSADSDVAAVVRREQRALVTLDLDFADVRRFPPAEYSGLIVLRPESQHRARLVGILRQLLPQLAREPLDHRLWIVDEAGLRVRE